MAKHRRRASKRKHSANSSADTAAAFIGYLENVNEEVQCHSPRTSCLIDNPLRLSVKPPPYSLPIDIVHFKPEDYEIKKYFFEGTSKQVALRQIFLQTPLNDEERKWIADFEKKAHEENFTVPRSMKPVIPRVLLFNWRRHREDFLNATKRHLINMIEWRKSIFPIDDTEPELRDDLRRGAMYWVGRDVHLKPILVISLAKLPHNITTTRLNRLVVFCFEWAMRHLLIPGKCETCSVLVDVRKVALYEFPLTVLAEMASTLTIQYPCRLDKMWILNDSYIIQGLWAVAKNFLSELQQDKIQFLKSNIRKELCKEIAMNQLERRHGGTRENVEEYYPFPLCPGPFRPPGSTNPHDYSQPPNCHECVDEVTSWGVVWATEHERTPVLWKEAIVDVCLKANVEPPHVPNRPPPTRSSAEYSSDVSNHVDAIPNSFASWKSSSSIREEENLSHPLRSSSGSWSMSRYEEKKSSRSFSLDGESLRICSPKPHSHVRLREDPSLAPPKSHNESDGHRRPSQSICDPSKNAAGLEDKNYAHQGHAEEVSDSVSQSVTTSETTKKLFYESRFNISDQSFPPKLVKTEDSIATCTAQDGLVKIKDKDGQRLIISPQTENNVHSSSSDSLSLNDNYSALKNSRWRRVIGRVLKPRCRKQQNVQS